MHPYVVILTGDLIIPSERRAKWRTARGCQIMCTNTKHPPLLGLSNLSETSGRQGADGGTVQYQGGTGHGAALIISGYRTFLYFSPQKRSRLESARAKQTQRLKRMMNFVRLARHQLAPASIVVTDPIPSGRSNLLRLLHV